LTQPRLRFWNPQEEIIHEACLHTDGRVVFIECMRLPIKTFDCHSFTLRLVQPRQPVCPRKSSPLAENNSFPAKAAGFWRMCVKTFSGCVQILV
jgi:hypothetical protein